MIHVVVTILVTLALPAAALAVIARIERSKQESRDGMQLPSAEPIATPEFEVSAQPKAFVAAQPEEPRYRERAG